MNLMLTEYLALVALRKTQLGLLKYSCIYEKLQKVLSQTKIGITLA